MSKDGKMIFLNEETPVEGIHIGKYSYYGAEGEEDFFEDNVLYHRPGHGDLTIGNFCSIANGVQFIMGAANHSMQSFSSYPFNMVRPEWRNKLGMTGADMPQKGDTTVGHDVWIGREATILPGGTVGNGAVIGAKSVVAKDVPPYAIVAGNPAKVIKYRFNEGTIAFLQELEWWYFTQEQIDEAIPYLTSLDLEASKKALFQIKTKS